MGCEEWLEVSVVTSREAEEAVSELLMQMGAGGVAIEDPRLLAARAAELGPALVDEPDAAARWRSRQSAMPGEAPDGEPGFVVIKAYLAPPVPADELELLARRVRALASVGLQPGPARVTSRLVRSEDWANAWKKHYTTLHVGRRLVIVPSWLSYEAAPDDVVVTLDPGMAFGTGTHPTTQLCLVALEEVLSPGDRLLDLGTGSGILAIAAAKLGSAVLALDIDARAWAVAQENALMNGVQDAVVVSHGTLEGVGATELFDVIVANIVTDTIIAILPSIPKHLKPSGCFVASGIVRERLAEVEEAWGKAGLVLEEVTTAGEWACVLGRPGRGGCR